MIPKAHYFLLVFRPCPVNEDITTDESLIFGKYWMITATATAEVGST
jgi:hypothetical protein